MKRFYIIEAIAVVVFVVGFILGRYTVSEERYFRNYYEEAAKL